MPRQRTEDATIATAAEWRLIGLLLERPRPGWHEELQELQRELPDAALQDAVAASAGASEGSYLRLLGPGGVVSPREVTYQPFADPGQLLARLAVAYDAFAFRPRREEPLDHIAVEVAFVGYLWLKQAFAAARGDRRAAATTARARRAFVDAHLAPLAAAFAQRMEATGPSYLLPVARLLAARVPAQDPVPSSLAVDANAICAGCGAADAS